MQDILYAVSHTGDGLAHGGQPLAVHQFLLQLFDFPQILEKSHGAHHFAFFA